MSATEAIRRIQYALENGRTELELTYLKLEALPPELFEMNNLEVLTLHNNQLSHFPIDLARLPHLKRLFLEFNHLTELPPELADLRELNVLALNGNRLRTLPEALWDSNVAELYLAGNPLRQLPPAIGRLQSLQKLYLGDTQLSSLPPEIGELKQLRALHLPNNQLRELPASLGQLTELQVLNLSGNRLDAVPPEIAALPNLRTLNLTQNPLPAAVIEGAKAGPDIFRGVIERHRFPGLRLHVSGDPSLSELRAYLSALEHAFNSYLVFERIVDDVARNQRRTGETTATDLPNWPTSPEIISARVRDNKRLRIRDIRWGLNGAIELSTQSTKTFALTHLFALIKRESGKQLDRAIEKRLIARMARVAKLGLSETDAKRLVWELVELPQQALFPFIRRRIIGDAELVGAMPEAAG